MKLCPHDYPLEDAEEHCAGCWPIYAALPPYGDTSLRVMLDVIAKQPEGSSLQVDFLRNYRWAIRTTRGSDT